MMQNKKLTLNPGLFTSQDPFLGKRKVQFKKK